jgi:hypothetical protein
LAQALLNDPLLSSLTGGFLLPSEWTKRADELLSLRGDKRRHALVLFSHHLVWLFHIEPSWAERTLLSVIDKNDDDAAVFWAGFFWAAKIPQESLYLKMKSALLRLAHESSLARRQHAETLAGMLLNGWGRRVTGTGERAIRSNEMREVLINADDEFRSQVIWNLDAWSRGSEGAWSKDALIFSKRSLA